MTTVTFYEKPGCRNNTRQKALLEASGHQVIAHDLLTHPWTAASLRPFFGDRPVAEWFNRAAPAVKSGEITPERFDADGAIAAMLAAPILIRRPLLEIDGRKEVGFDAQALRESIGLRDDFGPTPETCPKGQENQGCSRDHPH